MYDSLTALILLLGGVATLVLLIGLVLSIVVFSTKSLAAEIIAWICAGLWLILDLFIISTREFRSENIPNFFIYPIFLTFFLLLQYRSNVAKGNKFIILYIAKTGLLLESVSTLNSQVLNHFITSGIIDYENRTLMLIYSITGTVISLCILIFACYRFLLKLDLSLLKKGIFKNAIMFTAGTFIFTMIIGYIIFFAEYTGLSMPGAAFFNKQTLLIQSAYFVFESLIAAFTAAYIYQYKTNQQASGN